MSDPEAVPAPAGKDTFQDLFEGELTQLFGKGTTKPDVEVESEPRVRFVGRDLVGLAFSGGGIRSATFCLGVLQGLARHGLLRRVHYHSTVSGGGYIGGFWTRLRYEAAVESPSTPPERIFQGQEGGVEHPRIRHLRRFSRFLAPRLDLASVEFGQMVQALLAALVPSLLATMSLALVAIGLLYAVHSVLAYCSPIAAAITAVTLYGGPAIIAEFFYGRAHKSDRADGFSGPMLFWHTALGLAYGAGVWCLADALPTGAMALTGPWAEPTGTLFSADAFRPCLVALGVGLAALGGRFFVHRPADWFDFNEEKTRSRHRSAGVRAIGRLLLLGTVLLVFSLLLTAAEYLRDVSRWTTALSSVVVSSFGVSQIQRWLMREGGRAPRAPISMALLQLISWLVVFAGAALVCGLFLESFSWGSQLGFAVVGWLLIAAIGSLALFLVFFEPTEVGLHAFYRRRIARAYLGPGGDHTIESAGDDHPIATFGQPKSPIHLVCCAANDLGGDTLKTLSRGGRSATISPLGVSVGNRYVPHLSGSKAISLAEAITASAAAFNSNMGSLSMKLGPAVTMITTALGLRLGLWVAIGRSGFLEWASRWCPGFLFFTEFFGLTRADTDHCSAVHLSDGAHFDNLALYELVRRRCTSVIVIDCGADPTFVFDDLGNAVRRIREDFGVEVDLDTAALVPDATGKARQHGVVGSLRYPDGEIGTLVYLKPNLTGDEPEDVRQYAVSNTTFPQQTTGDQFYDEAQWEAYRRLGVHAFLSMFDVRGVDDTALASGAIFSRVATRWIATPAGFGDAIAVARGAAMDLHATLPPTGHAASALYVSESWDGGRTLNQTRAQVEWVGRALGLVDAAFTSCELGSRWSHPLAVDLLAVYRRWMTLQFFRSWYPILRATLNRTTAEWFDEQIFRKTCGKGVPPIKPQVEKNPTDGANSLMLASKHLEEMHTDLPELAYSGFLQLGSFPGVDRLEVATVRLERQWGDGVPESERHFRFQAHHLAIPPPLWNAGIGSPFLEQLCEQLAQEEPGDAVITVCIRRVGTGDQASRADWARELRFYREGGFEEAAARSNGVTTLRRRVASTVCETRAHASIL